MEPPICNFADGIATLVVVGSIVIAFGILCGCLYAWTRRTTKRKTKQ